MKGILTSNKLLIILLCLWILFVMAGHLWEWIKTQATYQICLTRNECFWTNYYYYDQKTGCTSFNTYYKNNNYDITVCEDAQVQRYFQIKEIVKTLVSKLKI